MSTQPHCIPIAPRLPSLRPIVWPLLAIVLGTFMAILDNTVVNVALPTLERVFNVDLELLQWVVTGYILAQAAVIPLSGWLADRFGGKIVYLTAMAAFVTGSTLCAIAPTSSMLIGFRVVQGLGGGMLLPLGLAFIFRLSPPEQRGTIMGALSLPVLVAPALGPVVSGWLLEFANWRFIFLINLPIGLLALALGWRVLPKFAALQQPGAFDLVGAVLGPLSFMTLTFAVAESGTLGWLAPLTLGALIGGVVALVGFVWRELSIPTPLLELRVFRRPEFSRAILTQWLGQVTLFGGIFLVPLYLQQARGFGALETGEITFVQPVMAAVFSQFGGRAYDRLGARIPVVLGLALLTSGVWWLAQLAGGDSGQILLPLALWGAGGGLMMMPLNTHLLTSAPSSLVSRITPLTSALQNVVISVAIVVLATVVQVVTSSYGLQQSTGLGAAYADALLICVGTGLLATLLALTLQRTGAEVRTRRLTYGSPDSGDVVSPIEA